MVEKPIYVETPERTPYTLGITKAVADALTTKAESKITTQESEEYTRTPPTWSAISIYEWFQDSQQ